MIGAKRPNKRELEHMAACREGPCIPCLVQYRAGKIRDDQVFVGVTYDHKKSGDIRRGHLFGFGSCAWHHLRHPYGDKTIAQTREIWGPSLMDGSALFRRTYGTDDELIALQAEILEGGSWEG